MSVADLPALPVIVDAVILFTVCEAVGLVAWHRGTGRGVAPRDFLLNLASGLCLMLALRLAVSGATPAGIVLALLAAGAAHLADLSLRARRTADAARQVTSTRRLPRSVSP